MTPDARQPGPAWADHDGLCGICALAGVRHDLERDSLGGVIRCLYATLAFNDNVRAAFAAGRGELAW